jgi:recombination protein RecT
VTTVLVSNSKTVHTKLFDAKPQFAAIIPAGQDIDRYLQIAWGCIRQNEKLLKCTPESILSGVAQGCQLGLSFDPVLGQGFLVPYFNSKKQCYEAHFQAGYRGLANLAYNSGKIAKIYAEVVHKDDKFEAIDGTEQRIVHVKNLDVDREKEDDWRGAYAVAVTKDGVTFSKYLTATEIMKRRAVSKAADKPDSPWNTSPKEMWLKSPIRALAKLLPMSPETEQAIRAAIEDEYRDAGVDLPTPELPAGAVEVETAALPAKNGGKTPPEPSRPQERPFCTVTWREGGKQEVGVLSNVPYAVSEQSKFRDLFTKSGKVWYIQPADFADAVALFDDCGFDLRLPPEASADSGAAVAPPSAAPREPGVDEEIGI